MLRPCALWVARRLPSSVKRFVHQHRVLDRFTRHAFSTLVSADGNVATIESGPSKGLKLVIGPHTSHAHIGGTYELSTQLAVDRSVEPGFVCYDLGASIGVLTLLMARKAKHVYAFEPAPHAAAELQKHLDANGFHHVTIVPQPVSDCAREVNFAVTDVAYGSAIVKGSSTWPILKLRTVTLDEFAASHAFPDFIKIDVEGEEGRVLEGAQSILKQRRTIICCELHNEEAARAVLRLLQKYSYRVTGLHGEPFALHTAEPVPGELQVIATPCLSPTSA
jgi:FkbM family methyltransferase